MISLPIRTKCKLVYPAGHFQPLTIATFVEMEGFTADWESMKLTDDDLQALQISIMTNPKGPPVIRGTGGLRKLRFAPARMNCGKRDAMRICYAYFEGYGVVLLVVAYPKNVKDNLTPAECKAIKLLLKDVEMYLETKYYRWPNEQNT